MSQHSSPQPTSLPYAVPPPLRPGAVVVRHDRKAGLIGLLGGLGAGAFGVYLLRNPFFNEWWFFTVGGILFVFGVWTLVDRRPRLLLDDQGFTDFKGSRGLIPWDQILDARTVHHENARVWGDYLYVALRDPAVVSGNLSGGRRWPFKYPRPPDAAPHEATLPLIGLDVKPQELVALIRSRVAGAGRAPP